MEARYLQKIRAVGKYTESYITLYGACLYKA